MGDVDEVPGLREGEEGEQAPVAPPSWSGASPPFVHGLGDRVERDEAAWRAIHAAMLGWANDPVRGSWCPAGATVTVTRDEESGLSQMTARLEGRRMTELDAPSKPD